MQNRNINKTVIISEKYCNSKSFNKANRLPNSSFRHIQDMAFWYSSLNQTPFILNNVH